MLIHGQKYSCEACIRGHRVTTCKHHDRPLTKINRRGRPFSTCPICHRTPCAVPDEHARLKREVEGKSHHKKSNGRYSSPRPFQGFLPIAPRPVRSGEKLAIAVQESVGDRSGVAKHVDTDPKGTVTTAEVVIPPGLSESLPSTSSIASSVSSSSTSELMPVPPLDLLLDLGLELPLPILGGWDNPDLGLDLDLDMGKMTESEWSGLDAPGFCGLDMAAFLGQAQFWVGGL